MSKRTTFILFCVYLLVAANVYADNKTPRVEFECFRAEETVSGTLNLSRSEPFSTCKALKNMYTGYGRVQYPSGRSGNISVVIGKSRISLPSNQIRIVSVNYNFSDPDGDINFNTAGVSAADEICRGPIVEDGIPLNLNASGYYFTGDLFSSVQEDDSCILRFFLPYR